ncbi:hypothetical protein N0V90_010956 [Kalmusia sp. IMI 367209]|nr:hypothetical protein N0V90_010956 [Kalmusia sp. IMI 367209]
MTPSGMASDASEASASHTSSSDVSQIRTRRRARKRRGPPEYQFVTATDPSDFKGEKAKRSVRSQAMIQYRYQSAEQKRQSGAEKQTKSTTPPKAERVVPIPQHDRYEAVEQALPSKWHNDSKYSTYSTTSDAWWGGINTRGQDPEFEASWIPFHPTVETVQPSRYAKALTVIPLNTAAQRVVELEDIDERDAVLLHLLATRLASTCVGSNMDPFSAIPQFATRELDSIHLVRHCNRLFVSKQTLARWVPAMLSHPHTLLSSTIMSSTWRDMHDGVCGESRRTILLKAEIITWINERLQCAATRFDDTTIMVILHLLVGETWSGNEKSLRIHMSGIARLMEGRGQRVNLPATFDTVGLATTIVCCHVPIICEMTPLPQLNQFQAPDIEIDEFTALPESPLYCPRGEMISFINDPACSGYTYDLLCDVRDMTELFLVYSGKLVDLVEIESEVDNDNKQLRTLSVEYDVEVAKFRTKLASLPSAYTPGLPTTGDWIYEACRLTAVIHVSALITCVPFSTAADPAQNAIWRTAASIFECLPTRRLTDMLYEVLERTNTGDMWNNMAGVFYWVCAVGAAAARTPVTINSYQRPNSHNEAYATWVRRCLTMYSSRTLAQMIFEHPLPLLATQRKLLRIQELIGRGASRSQAF